MSRNQEIAQELAKLASLMAAGPEDSIGADDSFQVQDNSGRSLEIHNHNFSGMKQVRANPASMVLPQEDWNPPSLAEVQSRADAVYGDQTHNSDFYPKGLDAMDDLLMGHSSVVASKKKLASIQNNFGEELKLVMDIANELAKVSSSVAPGREDTIGFHAPRNEGPNVADRIDSNKSLESVRAVFKHEQPAAVTEYGHADFVPSMDTGGFEGSMGVQASANAPVTRRKQAAIAAASQSVKSESVFDKVASLEAADQKRFAVLIAKGRVSDAEAFLNKKASQKKTR